MRPYAGKTADQRRTARRARFIATGRRLFGARGFHATSMRAVLRESGLQARYFSESFTDMEDLLAAVHQQIDAELLLQLHDPLDLEADPAEQIRQMYRNLVRELENDPGAGRIKFIEAAGVSPRIDAIRRADSRVYVAAAYVRLPEPPAGSALSRSVFAQVFVSAANGMFVDWANGSLQMTGDELIEHCTMLFQALESKLGNPE